MREILNDLFGIVLSFQDYNHKYKVEISQTFFTHIIAVFACAISVIKSVQ